MLDKLYENIGVKIKTWAKWIFVIGTICTIITGAFFLIMWGVENAWWALLIIVLGPILSFISTWLLYAFGELVDDIHSLRSNVAIRNIEKNVQLIANSIMQEKGTSENAKEAKEENERISPRKNQTHIQKNMVVEETENVFEDDYWICGKCQKKNLTSRNDCWSCGNPK